MAKTIDYGKRALQGKSIIDDLYAALSAAQQKKTPSAIKKTKKVKVSSLDFESMELKKLVRIQNKINKVIAAKLKAGK
jgi:hypothetical protein